MNQSWAKPSASVKSRNIVAITRRFNSIACWVCKTILEVKDLKQRSKKLARFIEIANTLMIQKNFASLMAVIAGINKPCLARLKATFNDLPTRTIKKLNYRTQLASVTPPCIPYIGVFLIDLTALEESTPDLSDNLINFSKRDSISKVIQIIQQYQGSGFSEKNSEELLQYLWNIPEASNEYEQLLWAESLERENK